jgi:hypothetical protein
MDVLKKLDRVEKATEAVYQKYSVRRSETGGKNKRNQLFQARSGGAREKKDSLSVTHEIL